LSAVASSTSSDDVVLDVDLPCSDRTPPIRPQIQWKWAIVIVCINSSNRLAKLSVYKVGILFTNVTGSIFFFAIFLSTVFVRFHAVGSRTGGVVGLGSHVIG
jgi:hypothetical protein